MLKRNFQKKCATLEKVMVLTFRGTNEPGRTQNEKLDDE